MDGESDKMTTAPMYAAGALLAVVLFVAAYFYGRHLVEGMTGPLFKQYQTAKANPSAPVYEWYDLVFTPTDMRTMTVARVGKKPVAKLVSARGQKPEGFDLVIDPKTHPDDVSDALALGPTRLYQAQKGELMFRLVPKSPTSADYQWYVKRPAEESWRATRWHLDKK